MSSGKLEAAWAWEQEFREGGCNIVTKEELSEILCLHAKWLRDEPGGIHANLSDADLSDADLRRANLSGANGLIDAIKFIESRFERTKDGYIVYKTFGGTYGKPDSWSIEPGATIGEVCNPNRTDACGCGINVAPIEWVKQNYNGDVYKLLIRWEWLPGVVVPYNTDGKIRCSRAQIIGKVA